ncbi:MULTISPECIES: sugar ABC transporter ATP-binding protein [Falsihalocynthiibacter]|uniref:sugar ABC transporter ATP-binding protein n=1 Tax=Falsihalocynthiibacter TaxID=2854182 RepID=UPI0030018553
MTEELLLKISNVTKSFGPVRALKGVNFDLRKGEIHALAGENGAGKSTLMNIIDGILQPDSGEILIDGKAEIITSPTRAQQLGIGFVHQEIALCPDVNVAENIFMSATNMSSSFLMNYKELHDKADKVLSQLCTISPSTMVRDLSISNQQLVEIAKALTLDCRVLILDEPTAALTEKEAQILFGIMRKLADQGIAIVYISHRMVEIFDNCDRVTVFRDGEFIETRNVAEITPGDVVNAMVGRVIDTLYPEKLTPEEATDEIILDVQNLSDGKRFFDVNFQLKKGEILGIGGLIGAGRSEIAKGVCRLETNVTGETTLKSAPLKPKDYRESIEAGVVYLSEDRKGDGIFLDMAISANVSALNLTQVATPAGIISVPAEEKQAAALGKKLNLKYGRLSDPVSSLSGGNQQKVAIAKMLSVDPRLIFLDEPTRGVDVGAKVEIHAILRGLARSGVGIVVISSELPELIGLCDRVMVVREGRISGEVTGDELTEKNIMRLASVLDASSLNENKGI